MNKAPKPPFERSLSAAEVIREEREHIERARSAVEGCPAPICDRGQLAALSLSGGGIRSASMCMGFLQGMAEHRLLSKFDYVSAVSGGGYALGWWCALVNRICMRQTDVSPSNGSPAQRLIQAVRGAEDAVANTFGKSDLPQDAWERQHVRNHGNYLTVRTGLMSVDTWAPIFIILRNLAYGLIGIAGTGIVLAWLVFELMSSWGVNTGVLWPVKVAVFALAGGCLMFGWCRTCIGVYELDPANVKEARGMPIGWWSVTVMALTLGVIAWSALLVMTEPEVWWHPPRELEVGILFCLTVLAVVDAVLVLGLVKLRNSLAAAKNVGAARKLGWMCVPPLVLLVISIGLVATVEFDFAWLLGQPTSRVASGALCILLMHAWQATRVVGVLHWKWSLDSSRISWHGDFASYGVMLVFAATSLWFLPSLLHAYTASLIGASPWVKTGLLTGIFAAVASLSHALAAVAEGSQAEVDHRELWAWWGAKLILGAVYAGAFLSIGGWVLELGANQAGQYAMYAAGGAMPSFAIALWASQHPRLSILARCGGAAAVVFVAGAIIMAGRAIVSRPVQSDSALYWLYWVVLGIFVASVVAWVSARRGYSSTLTVVSSFLAAVVGLLVVPFFVGAAFQHGWIVGVLGFTAALILCRSSPNTFSMHELYRNRLVRAFLAAPRDSAPPIPPTGFNARNDPLLNELVVALGAGPPCAPRPFPVWAAAVNVTMSGQVGMQERRAASFSFSPLHCGLHVPATPVGSSLDADSSEKAFAKVAAHAAHHEWTTKEYERESLSLGTVVATSGAAFSSNSGSTTTPERALLLTLLGFRLGRWFPNPARGGSSPVDSSERVPANPWMAGLPLYIGNSEATFIERWKKWFQPLIVREAFTRCDIASEAVYVTDGGHFENLGVYEMIRRQVKLIVCMDAGYDPQFTFSDLTNLQSKVRADFGVELKIRDLDDLALGKGSQWAKCHFKEFDIIYAPEKPGSRPQVGTLIYCKSTLTGDEPQDIRSYRVRVPTFPHLSTVNQWFAESAFEAYRALGLHIGREAAEWVLNHRSQRANS